MGAYFSRAATAIVALGLAGSALAQTPPPQKPAQAMPPVHTTARGVRVLEAEPEPEPAPPLVVEAPPAEPVPAPAVEPAPPPPGPAVPTPTPVINFCPRPFDKPDLRLVAGTDFDHALAPLLKTGKPVVVDVDKPFPDHGAPPPQLTRWLSEVKAGGGTVTTKQYCEAARGSLGSWLAELFGKLSGGSLYRPARQYNVVMHADALDHVITQVEFQPKGTARVP